MYAIGKKIAYPATATMPTGRANNSYYQPQQPRRPSQPVSAQYLIRQFQYFMNLLIFSSSRARTIRPSQRRRLITVRQNPCPNRLW